MKREHPIHDPDDHAPTDRALVHPLLTLPGLSALAGGIMTARGLLLRGH